METWKAGFHIRITRETDCAGIPATFVWLRMYDPVSRAHLDGIFGSAKDISLCAEDSAGLSSQAARCILEIGCPAAVLDSIMVPVKFQGQGIGSRLLKAFLEILWEKGIDQVWAMLAWDEGRMEDLVRFYSRLGFLEVGSACKEPGEVVMVAYSPRILKKTEAQNPRKTH